MPIKIFSCVSVFLIDLIIFNFANIKNYRIMKINYIHKVFAVLFTISLLFSCESSKNATRIETDDLISKITINKVTLGNSFEMTVAKDKTEFVETTRGEAPSKNASKTESVDWVELNRIVSGLNLTEFETWPAPTQERLHDGARATTITLEMTDKSAYTSLPFDEGKPPAELQNLY